MNAKTEYKAKVVNRIRMALKSGSAPEFIWEWLTLGEHRLFADRAEAFTLARELQAHMDDFDAILAGELQARRAA